MGVCHNTQSTNKRETKKEKQTKEYSIEPPKQNNNISDTVNKNFLNNYYNSNNNKPINNQYNSNSETINRP